MGGVEGTSFETVMLSGHADFSAEAAAIMIFAGWVVNMDKIVEVLDNRPPQSSLHRGS